jgi:hypothetical protein
MELKIGRASWKYERSCSIIVMNGQIKEPSKISEFGKLLEHSLVLETQILRATKVQLSTLSLPFPSILNPHSTKEEQEQHLAAKIEIYSVYTSSSFAFV